jgi:hypothetical protein
MEALKATTTPPEAVGLSLLTTAALAMRRQLRTQEDAARRSVTARVALSPPPSAADSGASGSGGAGGCSQSAADTSTALVVVAPGDELAPRVSIKLGPVLRAEPVYTPTELVHAIRLGQIPLPVLRAALLARGGANNFALHAHLLGLEQIPSADVPHMQVRTARSHLSARVRRMSAGEAPDRAARALADRERLAAEQVQRELAKNLRAALRCPSPERSADACALLVAHPDEAAQLRSAMDKTAARKAKQEADMTEVEEDDATLQQKVAQLAEMLRAAKHAVVYI